MADMIKGSNPFKEGDSVILKPSIFNYGGLSSGKIYLVDNIQDDWIRIKNEDGYVDGYYWPNFIKVISDKRDVKTIMESIKSHVKDT